MNPEHKNGLHIAAIVAGLVSLPMTWFTIEDAQFTGGGLPGEMFNSMLEGVRVNVTGLNGSVTLLVQTPLWFVVVMTITANALQLVRGVPEPAQWATAAFAAIWTAFPVVSALGGVTPGLGWVLGTFAAAVPIIGLFVGAEEADETDS